LIFQKDENLIALSGNHLLFSDGKPHTMHCQPSRTFTHKDACFTAFNWYSTYTIFH